MTEEQEARSPAEECSVPFYLTFSARWSFFLLHTFESIHHVLVVSHLRGVDLVSGVSSSGDFSDLVASTHSWKQATGMGHGAGSGARFEKLSLIAVPMS